MKGILKKTVLSLLAAALVFAFGTTDASAAAKHNVTFLYGTKSVTVQVDHGANAPVPTDTAVPGYTFTSWVGNACNVTEDRVILGAYKKNSDPYRPCVSYPVVTPCTPSVTAYLPVSVPLVVNTQQVALTPYKTPVCTPATVMPQWTVTVNTAYAECTNYTPPFYGYNPSCYAEKHKIEFYDSVTGDLIDYFWVRDGQGAWVDPPHHKGLTFRHYEKGDGNEYSGEGVYYDLKVYALYKPKD